MTEQEMNEVGRKIQNLLPEGYGFTLITISPFADTELQQWNYISNCARKDMIEGLEQLLRTWKNQNDEDN